jgi:hypothetical protein
MQENQHQQSNQKSKSVFVVSSAIHAKHGVYSSEERIEQSIRTFESIRKHTDSDIIVLDGGYKNISSEEQDKLKEYITAFYNFSDTQNIQDIQKSTNWDIVKNSIELIMFGSFFNAQKDKLAEKYDRIFKLSGRYTLNDNFEYERHMKAKNKILIRGPYTSQFNPEITGGVTTQYMSRLWSFDSALLPEISDVYNKMFAHMIQRLRDGGYIDIEHLLQHHLPADKVELVSRIGVEGNIAPNGVAVSD